MKKLIMFGCILAIITSGCSGGGGGGVPVDNSRLSGDWAYVLMVGGSFITVRGIVTFNGDGTATHEEKEISTGGVPNTGPFNYTAYTNNQIVFEEFVGTLSSDGNFFAATDTNSTLADPEVMIMVAVKQPSGVDDSTLTGTFFSGDFRNTDDGTTSATEINEATLADNTPLDPSITVDEIIMPNPNPAPGVTLGYDVATDGLTTIYDAPGGTATGLKGIVSIDGNLFISTNATSSNTPQLSMSVKSSSGKTNVNLNGTYVLHQFMDDDIGTGNFISSISEVTFNGDDVAGFGTGTYTEIAKSNFDPGTNPLDINQPFNYMVDTAVLGNPATFLIPDPSGGSDHMYGVMSPDESVLGIVNVDSDGPGGTDTSVFLGVAVKK